MFHRPVDQQGEWLVGRPVNKLIVPSAGLFKSAIPTSLMDLFDTCLPSDITTATTVYQIHWPRNVTRASRAQWKAVIVKEVYSHFNRWRHRYLISITRMYIYNYTLVHQYMITRTLERGCLTSANVRLEWRSYSTRLSIKLHEQMSSACGETGRWTPYLPLRISPALYFRLLLW